MSPMIWMRRQPCSRSSTVFRGFYKFDTTGVAQPGDPQLRIGLARVGGVEIELIEPQGSATNLFSEVLPRGSAELAIRFHHVAIRIDGSLENWQRHRAAIDTVRHPIAYQGALGDMLRYFYTDERPTLGHYVEHVWMSPDLLAQLGAGDTDLSVTRPGVVRRHE